jgi:hypothetical protein
MNNVKNCVGDCHVFEQFNSNIEKEISRQLNSISFKEIYNQCIGCDTIPLIQSESKHLLENTSLSYSTIFLNIIAVMMYSFLIFVFISLILRILEELKIFKIIEGLIVIFDSVKLFFVSMTSKKYSLNSKSLISNKEFDKKIDEISLV